MSNKELNIIENVMDKIKTGETKMKSRWYFFLGSLATIVGFIFLVVTLVFLMNLIIFSIKAHGPMADIRFEKLVSNFPWWAPIVSIFGVGFGIWMLKKFDFSYKKNFILIIIFFILTIIVAGWFVDYLGFNNFMKKGPMKGFYREQIDQPRGQGFKHMR